MFAVALIRRRYFVDLNSSFKSLFDVNYDPDNIILDFANSRVIDISGVEAIDDITKKYLDLSKKVTLKHLSEDCRKIIKKRRSILCF